MFNVGDRVKVSTEDIKRLVGYGIVSNNGTVCKINGDMVGIEFDIFFDDDGVSFGGHNCHGTTKNGNTGWFLPIEAVKHLDDNDPEVRAEKLLNGELYDVESEYPKNFLDEFAKGGVLIV